MDGSVHVYKQYTQDLSQLRRFFKEVDEKPIPAPVLLSSKEENGEILEPSEKKAIKELTVKSNPDNLKIKRISDLASEESRIESDYKDQVKNSNSKSKRSHTSNKKHIKKAKPKKKVHTGKKKRSVFDIFVG